MTTDFINTRLAAFGGGQTRRRAEVELEQSQVAKVDTKTKRSANPVSDAKPQTAVVGQGSASSVEARETGGHPQLQALSFDKGPSANALLGELKQGNYASVIAQVAEHQRALGDRPIEPALKEVGQVAERMGQLVSTLTMVISREEYDDTLDTLSGYMRAGLDSPSYRAEVDAAAQAASVRIDRLATPLAAIETQAGKDELGPALSLSNLLLKQGDFESVVAHGVALSNAVGGEDQLPITLRISVVMAGAMDTLFSRLKGANSHRDIDRLVEAHSKFTTSPALDQRFDTELTAARDRADAVDARRHAAPPSAAFTPTAPKPRRPGFGILQRPSNEEIKGWSDADLVNALHEALSGSMDLMSGRDFQRMRFAESEAVQRDLLPVQEPTRVDTKVKNHVLKDLAEDIERVRAVVNQGNDYNGTLGLTFDSIKTDMAVAQEAGVKRNELPDARLLRRLQKKGRLAQIRSRLDGVARSLSRGDTTTVSAALSSVESKMKEATTPKKMWLEFHQLKADLQKAGSTDETGWSRADTDKLLSPKKPGSGEFANPSEGPVARPLKATTDRRVRLTLDRKRIEFGSSAAAARFREAFGEFFTKNS